jgi:PIN domain nuclease of toxin-antitoxin system
MAPFVETLEETAIDDGFEVIPLTAHLALKAALLDWNHRDPFDRMIAATALQERVPLVSSDRVFDAVGVERVWE